MEFNKLFSIYISASIAETFTYPLEYIKTLIQVNDNKKNKNYIIKQNIYKGIKPALLRQLFYSTIKITTYEYISENKSVSNKFLIGGVSGAIAQLVASPFDLLKVRCIINNNNGILLESKNIINNYGYLGLWKGSMPNILRGILINSGELASYQYSKEIFKNKFNIEEGIYLHSISSLLAGFCGAILCTPADVIKSRLMLKNNENLNMLDCLNKTVRNEGIISLYKGFFQIWLRLAPWNIIFWCSYEKLRILNGYKNF